MKDGSSADSTPQEVKVGDTTYTKLADLRPHTDKVNVFGIVKSFKPPAKSRGTDYYLSMTLADESSNGMQCTIFNCKKNELPQVQSTGDIVYLQNMCVNEYRGAPQLLNRKCSTIMCFSRLVPRLGPITTLTEEEYKRLKYLQKWAQKPTSEDLRPEKQHKQFTSIKDIISNEKVPSTFRCRVKVMGIISPLSVEEMVILWCNTCGQSMPIPRRFESTDSYTTDQPCEVRAADINQCGVPLLRCMYFFKMKLEDESGKSLVAHVSGKDAVTFLSGVPPTNFFKNQLQRYALLEILYNLTGENNPFSTETKHPRPLIECCLVLYYNMSAKIEICYQLCDSDMCT